VKSSASLKNKKILITCGPTWVPIDQMRVISNRSSGKLGQKLALALASQGARVTMIEGTVAVPLQSKKIKILKYHFFDELKKLLILELAKKHDVVIHAAAVSDFKLQRPLKGKISSNLSQLHLTLIPTEKLIRLIKKVAPEILLVGFKLESRISLAVVKSEAESLIKESGCDVVVVNSLDQGYSGYVVDRRGKILAKASSRERIILGIMNALKINL
jgi:phosphopantothenoylcysteine decarboxylase/phosphopantothenate--cysteine ligase